MSQTASITDDFLPPNAMRFDLTYSVTETAFMRACHRLWAHRAIGARGNQMTAAMIAALGLFMLWQGVPGLWPLVMLGGAAGIVILSQGRERLWRNHYRNNPKFSGDIRTEFSPDGITTQSTTGQSDLPWTHFKSFLRTEDAFLLIKDPRQFSIIPLDAFADPTDAMRFEALLITQLKRLPRRYF